MEIRSFPADAVVVASGGCGLIYGRSTMSMACTGSAVSRCFQAGVKYANGEFIQVHPTAIPGAGQTATDERIGARRRGPRLGAPHASRPHGPRLRSRKSERYYFLEERYPTYGNLVPRDIATREIFNVCVNEGLSVEADRQCVYLDLTHIERSELDRKLGGILEIYEKFQGVDPRDVPMKIFPAVHYSHGWPVGRLRTDSGRAACSPARRATNVTNMPGLYAIGECDYQYHGANRLGANSLLSCIFTGLIRGTRDCRHWLEVCPRRHRRRTAGFAVSQMPGTIAASGSPRSAAESNRSGKENPYLIHQELGDVMTKAATVVRENGSTAASLRDVNRDWTNGREHMFALRHRQLDQPERCLHEGAARHVPHRQGHLEGALLRDECRGAHYKPEFEMPGVERDDPGERVRLAEAWCERFVENNRPSG